LFFFFLFTYLLFIRFLARKGWSFSSFCLTHWGLSNLKRLHLGSIRNRSFIFLWAVVTLIVIRIWHSHFSPLFVILFFHYLLLSLFLTLKHISFQLFIF
jgi:hypothetical protein